MKEIRFDAGHIYSGDQLDELAAWVGSLGVDPKTVCAKGLIVRNDDGSATLYLSRHVLDEAGDARVDWARDDVVAEPLAVRLDATATWPAFLTDREFVRQQRLGLARDMSSRLAHILREIDDERISAEVDA